MAVVADFYVFFQVLLVLVLGVAAARFGRHFQIPEALPLLIVGLVLGSLTQFKQVSEFLNIDFGFLASLAIPIILFVEGLKTDPQSLRQRWVTLFSVVNLGVVVTVIGIGAVGHFVLGMPWLYGLLLGAVLASTDPAAIIPLLRKLNLNKKISSVLEAETAFNDAAAITIFFIILTLIGAEVSQTAYDPVTLFVKLFVLSIGIGLVTGLLLNTIFRRVRIEKDLMLVSVVLLISTYIFAELAGASGIIAVVIAAIIFGGYVRSVHVDSISRIYFFEAWEDLSFLATALIFLVLGSQINLVALEPYFIYGLAIALAFMFFVRPLTILISMFFDRSYSLNEKLFISWIGGPRGVVSAALSAIIVVQANSGKFDAQAAGYILGITLMVIVATVTITSFTAKFAAKKLLKKEEDVLEFEYRLFASELKMIKAGTEKLHGDFKIGLMNAKVYHELLSEIREHEQEIEKKMAVLSEQKPAFLAREKAAEVERVITTQVSHLEELYSKGELSEDGYRKLLQKNNEALDRLNEIRN